MKRGHLSTMKSPKKIPLAIALLAVAVVDCGSANGQGKTASGQGSVSADTKKESARMKIQEEIEQLRKGGEFHGDISAFKASSTEAIDQLGAELRRNPSAKVREEIVRAMVRLATDSDPDRLMTDRRVLSSLFEEGSILDDCAYMRAMDDVAEYTPTEVLAPYGDTLARLAGRTPVSGLFLVIAKAKAIQALPALQARKADPAWIKDESFRIALAALGDQDIERSFIDRFHMTQDASEKMDFARSLGRIGTRSALKALAREMRSPLVFNIPATFDKSVRPAIAQAIHYSYPRNRLLLIIDSDSDYEKIEKFCEKEFGTTWNTPRPPYLNIRPLAPPGW